MNESVVWLQTSAQSVGPFLLLIRLIAGIVGIWMTGVCIMRISSDKKNHGTSRTIDLVGICVGSMLFSLQGVLVTTSFTIFEVYGGYSENYLFTPKASSGDELAQIYEVFSYYMYAVGYIWNLVGVWVLYSGPKNNTPNWALKAAGCMLIAALCANLYLTIDMASATFGGDEVGTQYFKFT